MRSCNGSWRCCGITRTVLWPAWCYGLLATGARVGEALSATWQDIDREGRVWVVQATNSKSKKRRSISLNDVALSDDSRITSLFSNEGGWGRAQRAPRSRGWGLDARSSRLDPRHPNAEVVLESSLSVLDELQTLPRYRADGRLFIGKRGPLGTINKVSYRVRAAAGLGDFRLHELRHSYASMLVNGGHSLYEVQAALGHSDPKVTMRYSHLSQESLQSAANSAGDRIKAAMGE